ncbi:hypothetical protein MNU23_17035 [Pseudomonas aeruginosa]|uniref:hypothetical protein n=1 Tax=Pseudomonas aeruginosa TaxID=287 RepID=UPI0021A78349|nr:hypothetical protein [Pseudomonas aeruginosa]MCT2413386.1 hypothetical protein [Pseudomonas aeruginosa]
MSLLEQILTFIGTVASIGSAIWAFIEARKAAGSATEAQRIQHELIERRKLVEASQIHSETTRILGRVAVIGPSCNRESMRGVKHYDIAKEVEEYSRFLSSQSQHFSELFENRAEALCLSLRTDIETLSEAEEFETIKNTGKSIHYKILDFLPITKMLSDEKKERPPL